MKRTLGLLVDMLAFVALGAGLGALLAVGFMKVAVGSTDLSAPLRAAILQHDRAVLSAELDDARHERESAYIALGLLCNPRPCDCEPRGTLADDCALPWQRILDDASGQIKLRKYGTARVVSWWPDSPGKQRK